MNRALQAIALFALGTTAWMAQATAASAATLTVTFVGNILNTGGTIPGASDGQAITGTMEFTHFNSSVFTPAVGNVFSQTGSASYNLPDATPPISEHLSGGNSSITTENNAISFHIADAGANDLTVRFSIAPGAAVTSLAGLPAFLGSNTLATGGHIGLNGGAADLSIETTTFALSAVPRPAALPLFGAGLAGLGFAGWKRRTHRRAEGVDPALA
jgi:hypothetical protein